MPFAAPVVCSRHPVFSEEDFCSPPPQQPPVSHLLNQIGPAQLEEEDWRTHQYGPVTQVAASWLPEREELCWIGSVLVYIAASFLPSPPLPSPSSETERLSQRDFSVEAWETKPPPPSSVHYVWPPTYHAPPPTHPTPWFPLLSVKERKTDTCMHCFQCHNYWTRFIWNL